MELTLGAVAILTAGLMVGNESAVAVVHAAIRRLPDVAHAATAKSLAGAFGRAMPFWYAGTLMLTIAVAAIFPWGAGSWRVVGAAAIFAASIVLTIAVLVPINNRIAKWDLSDLPPDWLAERQRWDRFHTLRVALLCGGYAALVVGVLTSCPAD